MSRISPLFDYTKQDSLVNRLRRRRADQFKELLSRINKNAPVRILDIGATIHFWNTVGRPNPELIKITLLNLARDHNMAATPGFHYLIGDAALLPFQTNAFDVVFSNSVIEHMGSPDRQRAMAKEVQRVGRRYYIQTPSK